MDDADDHALDLGVTHDVVRRFPPLRSLSSVNARGGAQCMSWVGLHPRAGNFLDTSVPRVGRRLCYAVAGIGLPRVLMDGWTVARSEVAREACG
jgi:hypothetical protein